MYSAKKSKGNVVDLAFRPITENPDFQAAQQRYTELKEELAATVAAIRLAESETALDSEEGSNALALLRGDFGATIATAPIKEKRGKLTERRRSLEQALALATDDLNAARHQASCDTRQSTWPRQIELYEKAIAGFEMLRDATAELEQCYDELATSGYAVETMKLMDPAILRRAITMLEQNKFPHNVKEVIAKRKGKS